MNFPGELSQNFDTIFQETIYTPKNRYFEKLPISSLILDQIYLVFTVFRCRHHIKALHFLFLFFKNDESINYPLLLGQIVKC